MPRRCWTTARIPTRPSSLALGLILLAATAAAGPRDGAESVVFDPSPAPADLCAQPFRCDHDYEDFLVRAVRHSVPQSEAQINAELARVLRDKMRDRTNLILDQDLRSEDLATHLREELNIGFLLADLDGTELSVRVLREQVRSTHIELDLLFEDPWIGLFSGLMLLPLSDGPHAAVLGLPGHGDYAASFLDKHHGDAILREGIALLALDLRVDSGGPWEDRTARRFLEAGFSLFGLHVYEAFLARKYLRSRDDIDPARIALMGHSGGAMVADVSVHLDPYWAALTTDFVSTFFEVQDDSGFVLCETLPSLYPIHPQLEKLGVDMPVGRFEYGYPEGERAVVEFLVSVLLTTRTREGAAPRGVTVKEKGVP